MTTDDDRLLTAVRALQSTWENTISTTYGVFDDADDGHLIEGGFINADAAADYVELMRSEGDDDPTRIEPQCQRHPEYPEGEQCEDCEEKST